MTDLTRFTDGSIAGRQAARPGPLRGLHRAVLRRFLDTGAPPTARWVRQAATERGLDAAALDELDAADAVHVVNGVVAVAYPLTVRGGAWSWTPASTVVVAARSAGCGTDCGSFEVMCPHTAFRASRPSARAWLAGGGGLDAEILDQKAAIECGRLNFGTLLTGPA